MSEDVKKAVIFEDVDERKPIAPHNDQKDLNIKPIRIWLWVLFALVVLMIAVGGLTRLTDSGLSITDWELIMGSLPPLNAADWQSAFEKYQQTEEFKQINSTMTIESFRSIYWWEWGHRFLGRIIGLIWFGGFMVFLLTHRLPKAYRMPLFWLGVFIALQGVIGILMVKSGYIGSRVDVASYALAAHLGGAFFLLAYIYWYIRLLGLSPMEQVARRREGSKRWAQWGWALVALVFLQILLGALVAGIDAGRSYTDWPLMGGEFFSSDSFIIEPLWKNFFENPALVQFMHRMNAYFLTIVILVWLWLSRTQSRKQWRNGPRHLALAIILQVILGIVTLIHGAPLGEALMHQIFAVLIWVAVLSMQFGYIYPREQKIS